MHRTTNLKEQPPVHTGIMRIATMTAHARAHAHTHTQVPVYWHIAFKKYCCNIQHVCTPWSGRDSNFVNPKFHFETDSCGMVSALTLDVYSVQTADKTHQLMKSTIRQLVADYAV